MAPSWPILVATCCQLGPNFGHLAPIFAPTCAEIPRKSRPGRQEPLQDSPRRLQGPVLWILLTSGASFFMISDPFQTLINKLLQQARLPGKCTRKAPTFFNLYEIGADSETLFASESEIQLWLYCTSFKAIIPFASARWRVLRSSLDD